MNRSTVKEHLHWCYANLAMAHSAIQENGQSSTYKPVHFMIRARLYKGLNDGSMTVRSLFDDEKEKMEGETCCCICGDHENPVQSEPFA